MENDKRIPIIEAGIAEAERFIIKAKAAIERIEKDDCYGCKETGAVKRAALDVKRAMTDINQMTTY